MNIEELMRPRYKVIATWPGMHVEPFHVGQIVTLQPHTEEDAEGFIYVPNKHIPKSFMCQYFFDMFPHLFKKLEWWEDRKLEDMPEYVNWQDEQVFKIIEWKTCTGAAIYFDEIEKEASQIMFFMNKTKPATAAEYEQYINQKEKQ